MDLLGGRGGEWVFMGAVEHAARLPPGQLFADPDVPGRAVSCGRLQTRSIALGSPEPQPGEGSPARGGTASCSAAPSADKAGELLGS